MDLTRQAEILHRQEMESVKNNQEQERINAKDQFLVNPLGQSQHNKFDYQQSNYVQSEKKMDREAGDRQLNLNRMVQIDNGQDQSLNLNQLINHNNLQAQTSSGIKYYPESQTMVSRDDKQHVRDQILTSQQFSPSLNTDQTTRSFQNFQLQNQIRLKKGSINYANYTNINASPSTNLNNQSQILIMRQGAPLINEKSNSTRRFDNQEIRNSPKNGLKPTEKQRTNVNLESGQIFKIRRISAPQNLSMLSGGEDFSESQLHQNGEFVLLNNNNTDLQQLCHDDDFNQQMVVPQNQMYYTNSNRFQRGQAPSEAQDNRAAEQTILSQFSKRELIAMLQNSKIVTGNQNKKFANVTSGQERKKSRRTNSRISQGMNFYSKISEKNSQMNSQNAQDQIYNSSTYRAESTQKSANRFVSHSPAIPLEYRTIGGSSSRHNQNYIIQQPLVKLQSPSKHQQPSGNFTQYQLNPQLSGTINQHIADGNRVQLNILCHQNDNSYENLLVQQPIQVLSSPSNISSVVTPKTHQKHLRAFSRTKTLENVVVSKQRNQDSQVPIQNLAQIRRQQFGKSALMKIIKDQQLSDKRQVASSTNSVTPKNRSSKVRPQSGLNTSHQSQKNNNNMVNQLKKLFRVQNTFRLDVASSDFNTDQIEHNLVLQKCQMCKNRGREITCHHNNYEIVLEDGEKANGSDAHFQFNQVDSGLTTPDGSVVHRGQLGSDDQLDFTNRLINIRKLPSTGLRNKRAQSAFLKSSYNTTHRSAINSQRGTGGHSPNPKFQNLEQLLLSQEQDDIILESPEGENQHTFHKQNPKDSAAEQDLMFREQKQEEGQLLINDEEGDEKIAVNYLTRGQQIIAEYQDQHQNFEQLTPTNLQEEETYLGYQPQINHQEFQRDPQNTQFFLPPDSTTTTSLTMKALCEKLIHLYADKTSLAQQLDKEREENKRLLPLANECLKLRTALEVRDREIKKLEQSNENRKQAKSRLKLQIVAMKEELEKERAQMLKDFKEFQDNFCGALRNQVSNSTNQLIPQQDNAVDMFMKRLSMSSFSQNNPMLLNEGITKFNSNSPMNLESNLSPLGSLAATGIQKTQQLHTIPLNAQFGGGFGQAAAMVTNLQNNLKSNQQQYLKRETLQVPDVLPLRRGTHVVKDQSLEVSLILRTATENQNPLNNQGVTNVENLSLVESMSITEDSQQDCQKVQPDESSENKIIMSEINKPEETETPPTIQIDANLNRQPTLKLKEIQEAASKKETRQFMITKWKAQIQGNNNNNTTNSDFSNCNQGSGRPQINISLVGNKLGCSSIKIIDGQEQEEEKIQLPQEQQISTNNNQGMLQYAENRRHSLRNNYVNGDNNQQQLPTVQNTSNKGVDGENSENVRLRRYSKPFNFYRQDTMGNTKQLPLLVQKETNGPDGIPLLFHRQYTKISYKDGLAAGNALILPQQQQHTNISNKATETLHDLLRQRTMKQASQMATQSMDGLYNTLTNSLIEQMTMKEEHLTERCLVQTLDSLKAKKKTFIDVFGSKIYDVKETNTQYLQNKTKFVKIENQYILDQDLFELMNRELEMQLSEDTKRSLVQYLGRQFRKDTIMFEYNEVERLMKIALPDQGECFSYITSPMESGLDLTQLNSKSFRLINRIREFMEINGITLYSQLFPDGMIKVSKIKQLPLILIDDFYTRLQTLQIRKSRERIEALTKFLIQDFRKMYLKIDLLAQLVDLSKQGNPYMVSFGTKRRRLPEDLKVTLYRELELQKKKIVEEDDEGCSIESQSSFLKSSQSQDQKL